MGLDGDDVQEVPRRLVGEDDDAYTRRLVEALVAPRVKVLAARLERAEATMSTMGMELGHVAEEQIEARQRVDRLAEGIGGAEARILHAIAQDKRAQSETCRAIVSGIGDAARAVAASNVLSGGAVAVGLLTVLVLGAWLLDLAPSMRTDWGSVEFAPKQVAPAQTNHERAPAKAEP